MGYLNVNDPLLDAKLTNKGRERIAYGDFNISYFQIGDSEFDYSFKDVFTQKVISPMDKHTAIKCPYLLSETQSGSTTGTTYGVPIRQSTTLTTKYQVSGTSLDPWKVNIVWPKGCIGIGSLSAIEVLSNSYVSTKEYFGYGLSSNQVTNQSIFINNSFGQQSVVSPDDVNSIAILHYTNETNPYLYDDYIANSIITDFDFFKVTIPNILYDRNVSGTSGQSFTMLSNSTGYISSSAIDSKPNSGIRYRYLLDEKKVKVGKVFPYENVIIFDDPEIVAVLSPNSQRKYTLPIPKIDYASTDLNCSGGLTDPFFSSDTSGSTFYVTYALDYTGVAGEPLPCNHYLKIKGTSTPSDLSFRFGSGFTFMSTVNNTPNRFVANKFYILIQEVPEGGELSRFEWKKIDYSSLLDYVGGFINPVSLRNSRFIITKSEVENGVYYNWSGPNVNEEERDFPGNVNTVRSKDVQVMKYYLPLPAGTFETTQNKTYEVGNKFVTEVGLFDKNFDLVVTGKFSRPVERVGDQVISVALDI